MSSDLARARSAAERFARSLSSASSFDENLADEYNRLRKSLASSFQSMSLAAVPRSEFRLTDVKAAVSEEMRTLFSGRVDSSLFSITGYTTPHPDLYSVLAQRAGEPVPGWRLRLLSGDKVHTERRTRELRDLGLQISVLEQDDDSVYVLETLHPDLIFAAAFQLRRNAMRLSRINDTERDQILRLAESTAALPERKTKRA